MKRCVFLFCVMLFGLSNIAWAVPPSDLFDADNNGVVDGWIDLLEVNDEDGTNDMDSDIDLDGDVDWNDVVVLDQYVTRYDTSNDFIVDGDDFDAIVAYLNAGGGNNSNYDVNGDGFVTSMDALWVANSLNKSAWQNEANSLDVNDDGFVTSMDALQIANFINANGEGPALGRANKVRAPFYDVDGDKEITEFDFDAVVNYLNSH
jgi:hypothetical protein